MQPTGLERVLRRDRVIVGSALALIAICAWAYVLWLASNMNMTVPIDGTAGMAAMPGMEMSGETIGPTIGPTLRSWSAADFLFMFLMWATMMVGMMIPSAAPMVLIYARVGRHAAAQGLPFAGTAWFLGGYVLAWTGFAAVASSAQWALEALALMTPMAASASKLFGGFVLIVAGLYQWTPLKDACLSQCQAPLVFIQRHGGFRRNPGGAIEIGLRHGMYCIGCCWALMALLFVAGVMNIVWIAAIAAYVLLEKIVPAGRILARTMGLGLVVVGSGLILTST